MDEIWLPCDNNRNSFRQSGVTSHIEIIEPFLDTDHFNPHKKPWNINNKSQFTFLSVFEFIPRKGWDILVEAFARAFKKTDDVCLIIKTHREHPPMKESDIKETIKNHLHNKGIIEWPKILFYVDPIPYSALPNLYTACDVFVLPTRGESICYPALEAMACGKPCIVTASGGQAEFINEETGYMIDYDTVPVSNFNHSPWYTSDQMMTEPKLTSLITLMQTCFKDRKEMQNKGLLARHNIEARHSLAAGYKRITQRLQQIAKEKNL